MLEDITIGSTTERESRMLDIDIRKETDTKVLASRKFKFPENWDELKDRHLISIAKVQDLPEDQGHIIMFKEIAGLSWLWIGLHLPGDEFYSQCVSNLLLPLLEKPIMKKGIMMKTVRGFTGMDDSFKNLSWGRWCLVDAFYTSWIGGNAESLDTLCALIYTPKDTLVFKLTHKGNDWQNHVNADRFIPMWKKKPIELKVAIAMHYGALRTSVIGSYKNLFPNKKQDPANDFNKSKKQTPVDYHALTISLSGGPFGNREKTEEEPVHNILKYLDMRAKEQHEQEIKSKK